MNKKVSGVFFSYLLIVVDILVGLLLVPMVLGFLGDEEYGIYKLLVSTASYLSVLDFGIGGTITRYVVKYRTEGDRRKEENFVAMGLIIYGVLSCAVIVIALLMRMLIPTLYEASIPAEQMGYAQGLFLVICSTTAVQLFNHAYNGLLSAYEQFTYTKVANIVKVLLRVGLLFVGLKTNARALTVVLVDFSLAAALLLANILQTRLVIKCKIKLHAWDWAVAKEAGVFTLAILAQSVINQFNTNANNVILGMYSVATTITMYSLALQLYNMYSSLSTAISSVYLPSISRAVFSGATDEQITDRIIAPSRVQLTVLLLALGGFVLLGREFIGLWVGEGYGLVYVLACILFISSTLDLSQNTITSVLKAKNKLHGKIRILAVSTAANVAITFLLVPRIGVLGAVVGTACSMIFGYGLALNVYFHKVIKINMLRYYRETYRGILPAFALSMVVGILITLLIPGTGFVPFLTEAVLYASVYGAAVYFVGLNPVEKGFVQKMLKKFTKPFHKS